MRITAKSPGSVLRFPTSLPIPGELVIMILRGEETVVPNKQHMENDLLVIYPYPEYREKICP